MEEGDDLDTIDTPRVGDWADVEHPIQPRRPGAAPSPLCRGAVVGRDEIRALIGAGGMGWIYRAHDPHRGREAVPKVVRNHDSRIDLERLHAPTPYDRQAP